MYKSCSKCGRIHPYNHKCYAGESGIRRKNTSANTFRTTRQWRNKAEEIKKQSKYLCNVCLAKGIYNYTQLETHHIEPIEENYERRLDDSNLICLCNEHHRLAEEGKIKREYLFKLVEDRDR